jgi:ubiquinone/menaquinone biosynthesis C-methylase UbiE
MDIREIEIEEINQGKIISENAEAIWNWSTYAGKIRAERRAKLIINYGSLEPNERVLEIGCGTGLFTDLIINQIDLDLIAIDISNDLLNKAKQRGLNVKFDTQSAHSLRFENNSFNKVIGSSVLHHLNVEIALKEFFRVLKPCGRIIFVEPNLLNPQIYIQKNISWIKKMAFDTYHETAFNRWRIKKILSAAGFQNCRIIPHEFLHPYTPHYLTKLVSSLGERLEHTPIIREIGASLIIVATKP